MQNKAGCLTTVSASYSVTKEEADARRMRLKELADSILAQSVTSEMDDCAKAKALHDYLCLHCTYDKRGISGQSGPASTEGVLRYGRGICLAVYRCKADLPYRAPHHAFRTQASE